jgi:hypothetical protein
MEPPSDDLGFSLGKDASVTSNSVTKGKRNRNLEETRMQTYGIGDSSKDEHMKERQNFSVKLRKSKK